MLSVRNREMFSIIQHAQKMPAHTKYAPNKTFLAHTQHALEKQNGKYQSQN